MSELENEEMEDSKLETRNSKPETRNSKPETRNSKPKTILIISAFDPLEGEGRELIRYPLLARALGELGASVTYLSSSFDHFSKRQRLPHPEDLPYEVTYIPTSSYSKNIGLRRLYNHYLFGKRTRKYLEKNEGKYDAILSAFPPIGVNVEVSKWAESQGIPFFVDVQDLWPEAWLNKIPSKFVGSLAKGLFSNRKKMLKSAHRVIAVSQDYLKLLEVKEEKGTFFSLGGNFSTNPPVSNNSSQIELILIAGSDQLPFLPALLSQVQSLSTKYKLTLVGRSQAFRNIPDSDRISVHFDVEEEQKNDLLRQADIGLVLNDPSLQSRMPNKIFSYLSYGLPIISNLKGGELEDLLKNENWGAVCETDLSDFSLKIEQLVSRGLHQKKLEIYQSAKARYDKQAIYKAYARYVWEQLA